MKKWIAMVIALAVCCAMVLPVAAEEFVPSISYKDHPEIVDTPVIKDEEQEDVDGAELVITPVSDALNTPEEDRDEIDNALINIYEQLDNGDMKLPVSGDGDDYYIVRDLIDLSVIDDNGNELDNVSIVEVTFDLGLSEGKEVVVMVYDGEQWIVVEDIAYNSNGTVTVVFDQLGPVAFCVEDDGQTPPSPTNDKMTRELITWSVLMIASVCAAFVMLISRRKARR